MESQLVYAVRGSEGFALKRGLSDPKILEEEKLNPRDAHCRCFKFSHKGEYFSYCNSTKTSLICSKTGKEVFATDLSKTSSIIFSPSDKYMVTYEPFVIYGMRTNEDGSIKIPAPNLRFWSIPDGKLLGVHKADRQDDSLALRLQGSEIHFFTNGNFDRYSRKEVVHDIGYLSIGSGHIPYIACFIPSLKGQPASIQLRSIEKTLPVISSKISFNCDKCSIVWNSRGNAFLATATVEVDKSNKSYYGVASLYCLTASPKNPSFAVTLDKAGPIYSVEWAPSGSTFAVCYGFMPSKVSLFNLNGDAMWELGEGHRNEIHFNIQSTIMATCAFGNLSSGKIQFYNLETKKEINSIEVPHTTHFEWAPDGRHFFTSSTAPRLRTDNVYRIWDYSGKQMYEKKYEKEELWEVRWAPSPSLKNVVIDTINEPKKQETTTNEKAKNKNSPSQSIVDNLPSGTIKAGKYVPPNMRKNNAGALQNKSNIVPVCAEKTAESERAKKVKNLQKKLDDIQKLKQKVKDGVVLEKNQEEKIKSEHKIIEELFSLTSFNK